METITKPDRIIVGSSSERATIANQLQSLRDQLTAVANRTDTNGLPLLGALGSAQSPFMGPLSGTPDYLFAGQAGQNASTGVSIPNTLDGDAAFMFDANRDGSFHATITQGTSTVILPGATTGSVPTGAQPSRALNTSAIDIAPGTTFNKDPATGQAYAHCPDGTAADVDAAVDARRRRVSRISERMQAEIVRHYWLLTQGMPARAIQWIKPREAWWLNRRFNQPGEGLPDFFAGVGLQLKAMAQGTSVDDVFARLEAEGLFLRVDTGVVPTMSRGAMISEAELALLRQIDDVVRLGHVRRIERDRIVFDGGSVPTGPGTLHVHCAAVGLARPALRPVFEADRVTLQPLFWGFACYPAALLGVIEATIADTAEKNRVCPPIRYWDEPRDYLSTYLARMAHDRACASHPAVVAWSKSTRLNPTSGLGAHRDNPLVAQASADLKQYGAAAAGNLVKLLQ